MEILAQGLMVVFLITLIIVFTGMSLAIIKLIWDAWND